MTTPDDLLAEAKTHVAEVMLENADLRRDLGAFREEARRLRLALAEEQARSANRAASLEAVREALGDAAGQTGTLAEDVAALVERTGKLEKALAYALNEWEYASQYKGDYLAKKHGDVEEIAARRALLAGRKEG